MYMLNHSHLGVLRESTYQQARTWTSGLGFPDVIADAFPALGGPLRFSFFSQALDFFLPPPALFEEVLQAPIAPPEFAGVHPIIRYFLRLCGCISLDFGKISHGHTTLGNPPEGSAGRWPAASISC